MPHSSSRDGIGLGYSIFSVSMACNDLYTHVVRNVGQSTGAYVHVGIIQKRFQAIDPFVVVKTRYSGWV